jgi:Na+-driven multidrug efflux pump
MGFGVDGAWLAMITDATVRSLLVLLRFLQGGWKEIKV